eukprot:TRINITY_DN22556_c0_g1_i1.p1 TRINITY_DN22556_c0_g1~~TRINITY_DN22556_c0_g1_i1.p1  ORF type:complete len:186 (+),score=0.76 TRINITY_DN22556_c0_g1_i1:95-652(+)
MSIGHTGRCLCGDVTYDTGSAPLWVTICYCRFCQRATGSDRMIEPIFEHETFDFTKGHPSVFTLASEGRGKAVHVHFCSTCGTKLALTFERWPDRLGIYIGTLDDPTSIVATPKNSKHVFVREARPGQGSRPMTAMPQTTTAPPSRPPSMARHMSPANEATHSTIKTVRSRQRGDPQDHRIFRAD